MPWLEGQDIQPGIKVLSGPFDWKSAPPNTIPKEHQDAVYHASFCDIQKDLCLAQTLRRKFQTISVNYTTVAIECKQKRANIPQNVILDSHDFRPKDEQSYQTSSEAHATSRAVSPDLAIVAFCI